MMICFRRRIYWITGVCLLGFVGVAFLPQIQKYPLLPKTVTLKGDGVCIGSITNNSISSLQDNRILVISPYFDNRVEKVTRVLAIVHHKEAKEPYCWFCCPDSGEIYVSKAVIDVHADRFGFPYAAADLICLEPANCDPRYVALHPFSHSVGSPLQHFEIRNRSPERSPVEFTVCISTMFGGYDNVLQFVQSLEMYAILGMQKVVIYKHSCSQRMDQVLEYYVAKGTVEIIPWPITSYLNVSTEWRFMGDRTQIGYYGQIAALNDCIYRNMYRTKYVLLNDADEIILPIKYADWRTMMSTLEEQNPESSVFLFENHIFPNTIFTPPSVDIPSWRAVPGVNILQHVLREPDRKEVINPRKMIVDPRKVVQTSVHSVLQAFGESVKVPAETAMVYHCRIPLQPHLPREALIQDTTLWRYKSALISRVSQVLEEIGL
ncbi:hypothetical protein JRQ81_008520 [Phrynocephalus forsythii]|uniref:Glycosyltransferase family 92 protein n=1 Tax=Phrynocephalus forsythii TaxID=171643 RepID=A0A9Q0XA98_9SAUR|nr:hypothetical protein JRQ81_008520 [Phrynocephalus forsythii]